MDIWKENKQGKMPQSISVVIIDSNADSINNTAKYIKNLGDNVAIEGTATTFEKSFMRKKRCQIKVINENSLD